MATSLGEEVICASAAAAAATDGEEHGKTGEKQLVEEKVEQLPPSFNAQAALATAQDRQRRRWCRALLSPTCDIRHDDSSTPPPPPPDGGLQAWSQVFAGHLVLISTWGYANCFGWFQAHYILDFHLPASTISWIVSFQLFLLSLLAAPVGRAFDAGYYRHLTTAGFAFQVAGIFATSFARRYWHAFLAQGVCGGIAAACLWTPHVGLVSTWFLKRRSFALALMLCGTSVGGVVWPVIAQQLGPVIGFAWTVRTMGFAVLGMGAVVLALTRTRIPPRKAGPLWEGKAFRETPYALFVVGAFFSLWAVYFAYFYVNQYATDVVHVDYKTSLSILYLMNGVSILGRIAPALIADASAGPVVMYALFAACSGVAMYCWIAARSLGGVIAFSAVYGFFGSGVQGLLGAALAYLTPDLQKIGVRVGMTVTVASVPILTGSPLAGALIQLRKGDYLYAQVWGGSCLVVGAAFVLAAAQAVRRQRDP